MTKPVFLANAVHDDLQLLAEERGMTTDQLISTWVRNGRRRDIKPYGAGDLLRFGQYGGEPVDNVIRTDPAYIKWLLANAQDRFTLAPDMLSLYETMSRRSEEEVPVEVRKTSWWQRMTGRGQ